MRNKVMGGLAFYSNYTVLKTLDLWHEARRKLIDMWPNRILHQTVRPTPQGALNDRRSIRLKLLMQSGFSLHNRLIDRSGNYLAWKKPARF